VYRFGGKEAMEAMTDTEPAIVLSDVLMPGMNGYELCRNIKTDQRFCHIPVILVTAKTTVENQIEGLEKGADAYITKPFNPKLLLALIKSQLDNREKLRNLLNTSTTTEKDEEVSKSLSPQDKYFMDELYAIMEKEMMNSELDVNQVAQSLGMSRSKFYYKMKGLTGTNPGAFFRTYKLNRAAEYLREGKYNVSEIADLTGFSSLSFFSTSFKKQFGVSPSEFA
jgi:YesN/AraC family two-component response regulator